MLIQAVATLIILFALSRVLLKLFKDRRSLLGSLVWTVFWGALLVLVWTPEILDRIGKIFGVGRGVDVLAYLGLITLFYLIYRLYIRLNETQDQITTIVREIGKLTQVTTPDRLSSAKKREVSRHIRTKS